MADVVLLLSSVPERTSDLVHWLDENQLKYRHGPAFPTLGGLIAHLVDAAPRVDSLLRRAHLDGQTTADVRNAIDPGHDAELSRPLQEALEDFSRVRRRTVDLLHGWGKAEWDRAITDPRGGEATLLDNRISVELTYYNKRTSDALIARTVAPSLGASVTRFENLGAVVNRGFEGLINARVIERAAFGWDVSLNFSYNTNFIADMGGVPPIIGTTTSQV